MKFNLPIAIFLMPLIACQPTVKVEAPKEPITINLNVNIEHRVKVQIDKDLEKSLSQNEDIF